MGEPPRYSRRFIVESHAAKAKFDADALRSISSGIAGIVSSATSVAIAERGADVIAGRKPST